MPKFSFKEKLQDKSRKLTWHLCTIPSAVLTQAVAAAGADRVIVDMELGAVDHGSAHAADLPLGTFAFSKKQADTAFAKGYRLIGTADVLPLKSTAAQLVAWAK